MALNDPFRHLPEPTYRERVLAVFNCPALYDLKTVLPATAKSKRRDTFPPLLQYGVNVASRIYGSQEVALRELAAFWPEVASAYRGWLGDEAPASLPDIPPTARQQDAFIERFTSQPQLLAALSERYTLIAIGQARFQGNFVDGVFPDYAHPDYRHAVFGDGTYLKPYSDVFETVDEVTGEVYLVGSRATVGKPHIQPQRTDPTPDKKKADGINHVIVSTWTVAGWVVLAHEQSLASEVKEARIAIGRISDVLGRRLHTVVWDMVLQGKDVARLMADARVMVVAKQPARKTMRAVRDGYVTQGVSDAEALRLFRKEQPLPLGTSVYERSENKKPTVERSEFHRYDTLGQDGCIHDLWVDDGALFDVTSDPTYGLVKKTKAESLSAVPVPDAGSQRDFTVPIAWRLPCPQAPVGEHRFETVWTPAEGRAGRPPRGPQRALHDLRPIARADGARFRGIHGLRNLTESYNSWFKRSLGDYRRAMRKSPAAQLLDCICTGTYANALSYRRFQQLADYTIDDAA